MLALRDRLAEREHKNAAQVATVLKKARSLRSQCQFEAVVKVLAKIPVELQTEESAALQEECKTLAEQRNEAIGALRSQIQSDICEQAPKVSEAYDTALKHKMLGDTELDQFLETLRLKRKDQQDAAAAAERRRALTKQVAIVVSGVLIPRLLISVGLRIASAFQASAVDEAVSALGEADFGRPGARQLHRSLTAAGITSQYKDYPDVEHLVVVQAAIEDSFRFLDDIVGKTDE